MSLIDYQDVAAKYHCAECGGEIYPKTDYYRIDNKAVCENCVDARVSCDECGYVFGEDGDRKVFKVGSKLYCEDCISEFHVDGEQEYWNEQERDYEEDDG